MTDGLDAPDDVRPGRRGAGRSRPHAERATRATRPRAAIPRTGLLLLIVVTLACVGSLPWTLGADASGRARFERTDLEAALLPPWWAPHRPDERAAVEAITAARGAPPRPWLGTDRLGRDLLARTLLGGAVSLAVGFGAATVATLIGSTAGAVAGASGGRIDAALMRSVDVVQGLPTILLVVLIGLAADGALDRAGVDLSPGARIVGELLVLVAAIGGVSWLTMARVVRGRALGLARRPFMEATHAIGMGRTRRLLRHLLPNLAGTIAAYAALAVPAAILSETFLSFLGLGVREPLPSWGSLAAAGIAEISPVRTRWWLLAVPCTLVAVVLVAMHSVTERMRAGRDRPRRPDAPSAPSAPPASPGPPAPAGRGVVA